MTRKRRRRLFQKMIKWAQPDVARRRYLRQWLGYNLTGDMGEQIFHVWYGPLAANGKSTIGNQCREAIGDYGDTINVETFLDEGQKKRGDQATPDLVRLPGVRLLTAGEPPKGAKINEALINSVTGGDPMNVRDNFRSFFRMTPIFKFTLWCNDLPAIPQGTAGIWRRVKVIPWEQHLKPEERDRDLPRSCAPNMRARSPGWCAACSTGWTTASSNPKACSWRAPTISTTATRYRTSCAFAPNPTPKRGCSRRCCTKHIKPGPRRRRI
jgi:P4 family phage/plasmid primase-like protien